jgi:GNAT superfamily N-acetyltransferase
VTVTVPIRAAGVADVPALVLLRMANAERHATLAPSSHRFPAADAVRRYFTERLSDPVGDDGLLLVAEVSGTVAGMSELVIYGTPPDHQILAPRRLAEVHTVVLDGYRGRGIGKALVAAAEQHASERGVSCLLAPILTANTQAVSFYSGSGFADYGVILSKDLTRPAEA